MVRGSVRAYAQDNLMTTEPGIFAEMGSWGSWAQQSR